MSVSEHPRGILRNKSEVETTNSIPTPDELDRQQVIKNTQLNAQLSSEFSSEGDKIREQIRRRHSQGSSHGSEHGSIDQGLTTNQTQTLNQDQDQDHLKWDELNLYKTEQEKSSTMKIDEPKTPYELGFNPKGEYYRDDDEEDELNGTEDIPNFELGESEFDTLKEKNKIESLHGGEVIKDEGEDGDEEEEEEEEVPLTAEERHKRFEELRKAHYHLRGEALHNHIDLNDVKEDD